MATPPSLHLPVLEHRQILSTGGSYPWISHNLTDDDKDPITESIGPTNRPTSISDQISSDSGAPWQRCESCKEITFAGLRDLKAGMANSTFSVSWTCPRDTITSCALCRLIFFSRTLRPDKSGLSGMHQFLDGPVTLIFNLSYDTTQLFFYIDTEVHGQDLYTDSACDISTLHDSEASEHFKGRSVHQNSTENVFNTIKEWLKTCDSAHLSCRRKLLAPEDGETPFLPSRVIYVGSPDGSEELRLIESRGSRGQYISLSHCWGSHLEVATTLENLASHYQRVDFTHLSATLQDAVTVTRRLGIQYIWIDSLCIIQDSLQDWTHEAEMMAAVYENAYCTIAATDAKDGSVGFLDPADPSLIEDLVMIPCDPGQFSKGCVFLQPAKKQMTTWAAEKSPLNVRAWVMQERILSRRILHFMRGMVYWECDLDFLAADGGEVARFETPLRVLLLDDKEDILSAATSADAEVQEHARGNTLDAFSSAHSSWFDLVTKYSRCGLTRLSDKLPAIRGLAQGIQSQTDLIYSHGLWLGAGNKYNTLELFWMPGSGKDKLNTRSSTIRAPSWSWASMDGEVQFWDTRPDYWEDKNELEKCFSSTIIEIITLPRFGVPDFTSLVIRSKLKMACRSLTRNVDHAAVPMADAESILIPLRGFPHDFDCNERSYPILKDEEERTRLIHDFGTETYQGWICFDCDEEEPLFFYCLPMMVTDRAFSVDDHVGEYEVWRVLALRRYETPSNAGDLEYRRVGYGEIFGERCLDGCEYQAITLV